MPVLESNCNGLYPVPGGLGNSLGGPGRMMRKKPVQARIRGRGCSPLDRNPWCSRG